MLIFTTEIISSILICTDQHTPYQSASPNDLDISDLRPALGPISDHQSHESPVGFALEKATGQPMVLEVAVELCCLG